MHFLSTNRFNNLQFYCRTGNFVAISIFIVDNENESALCQLDKNGFTFWEFSENNYRELF